MGYVPFFTSDPFAISSFILFKWVVLFSCTHLGMFFVFLYPFIKSFMTLQDVTS